MRMKKAVAGIAMVVSMALSFGGCSDSEKDSESEVKTVEKADNEATNNKNDRDDREEVKDTGEDKASDDKTQKDEASKDETSKGDESSDSTDDSSKENQKEDKDANTKEQENKTTKKNNTDSENKASTSKDSKPSESKNNEASDDSEDEQSAGDVTTNSDTQIKNEASKDTTSKVETQKETTAGQTTTQSQKETTAGQTTTQAQKETTASQTTTPPQTEPQTEPQTTPPASDTGVTLHEDVSRGLSEAIHQSAKNIVAGIIKGGMTEYDKVKAIHDYLVKNTYYPFNFSTADSYLFSAEGPLGDKKLAVCQGYTEAFSLLCYYAGIQTDIVYGTANNGTRTESHAWNTVRIDNEWYNVDVTWDDPLEETNTYGGNLCYAYFLVTDEFISKNHFAEDYTNKHSCTSTKFKETVKILSAQAYIASYYGDINYYYANTDDEIRAVISAHSTGETFLIVYDLGHLYTEADYESCSTIFSNIGGLVSKVYSGAAQLNCSMITSTEYLYVAITLK